MLARLPRGLWLGLVVTLVSAGLLLSPVAADPTHRILGNFQSEAATHAPALAAAVKGLFVHGPFVLAEHPLHPEEVTGAMYEPTTTLLFWPIYALAGGGATGFALAWNSWYLVVLGASAAGAWIWARAWLGDRDPHGWGAGLAMAIAASSLFVHLSPEVGRTEAGDYPLYALHGGLLFRAVRRGDRRAWGWAAASAVPVLWSGGYGSVFFAVAEPLVAVWALRETADRRGTLRGLGLVAVVAALAGLPLYLALRAHPYVGIAGRTEAHVSPSVALAVLVGQSENLLRELPGYEVAPFLGLATLALGLLSPLRLRAALPPLLAGLLLYAIAAGPHPTWGERELWGPAAVFSGVPGPAGVLRGWSRIQVFALPLFAVAAAALPRGRGFVAVLGACLALGETAWRRVSPASWWTLDEEPALVEARAKGQVPIPLPLDGIERVRRWLVPPPTPDLWVVMPDHDLFKYFQDALPNEPELFRNRFGAPAATYDPCLLQSDAIALKQLGFTSLYLREGFLPHDGKGMATRALRAVFGAPREEGFWPLPDEIDLTCLAADAAARPPAITLHGEEGAENGRPRTPAERAAIRAERKAERERIRAERLKQQQEKGQHERR